MSRCRGSPEALAERPCAPALAGTAAGLGLGYPASAALSLLWLGLVRWTARQASPAGVEIAMPGATVFEVRDHRVARTTLYHSSEEIALQERGATTRTLLLHKPQQQRRRFLRDAITVGGRLGGTVACACPGCSRCEQANPPILEQASLITRRSGDIALAKVANRCEHKKTS